MDERGSGFHASGIPGCSWYPAIRSTQQRLGQICFDLIEACDRDAKVPSVVWACLWVSLHSRGSLDHGHSGMGGQLMPSIWVLSPWLWHLVVTYPCGIPNASYPKRGRDRKERMLGMQITVGWQPSCR